MYILYIYILYIYIYGLRMGQIRQLPGYQWTAWWLPKQTLLVYGIFTSMIYH